MDIEYGKIGSDMILSILDKPEGITLERRQTWQKSSVLSQIPSSPIPSQNNISWNYQSRLGTSFENQGMPSLSSWEIHSRWSYKAIDKQKVFEEPCWPLKRMSWPWNIWTRRVRKPSKFTQFSIKSTFSSKIIERKDKAFEDSKRRKHE